MKIIQLNIWMGRLGWAATRFIESEKPDIICLQEAFQTDSNVQFPDRMYNCLDLIKEASGLEYVYFSPVLSTDLADGTADFGNAILSRYPMIESETIFTHGKYITHHTTKNSIPNVRNMQIVRLQVDSNHELTVINHHGHWEATAMGSETSVEKMKLVADRARQVEGPLIIAGDLNLVHDSAAMRVFDGWLADPVHRPDIISTLSGVGQPFDVVCDHILTSEDITVSTISVRPDMISDHLPVVMECRL